MKRIALVCQRYGLEVTGGAERYARQLAEHLADRYEVEILTTKAVDDQTWRDWYVRSTENIHGVTVRRFSVEHTRSMNFEAYHEMYLGECAKNRRNLGIEEIWFEKKGPYAPSCIQYIRRHKQEYDAILFVGYEHYLTAAGLPEAADRAVFIPIPERESPTMQFLTFARIFSMPQAYIFLTDEERLFVRRYFKTQGIPCAVIGAGVDVPDEIDPEAFRHRFGIRGRYILYAGKISAAKDCPMMLRYFTEYRKRHPNDNVKLVLIGNEECEIPKSPDIVSLGYLSDTDKYNGISGAEVMLLPSQWENLPDALLDAMSMGVPVLVNGASQSLRQHCTQSNAGLYYGSYFEFEAALRCMLYNHSIHDQMSHNAIHYVLSNYEWSVLLEKADRLFDELSNPEPILPATN